AGTLHAALDAVQLEGIDLEGGVGGALPAPQQGADAGAQLTEAEGLDDVIVGAEIEAAHPVLDPSLGGEQEHREVGLFLAQVGKNIEAVAAGEVDVEHQQIEVVAFA